MKSTLFVFTMLLLPSIAMAEKPAQTQTPVQQQRSAYKQKLIELRDGGKLSEAQETCARLKQEYRAAEGDMSRSLLMYISLWCS